MTINPQSTKTHIHGKNLYLWNEHNKGMDEKGNISLVTDGTHISYLRQKLGLRELQYKPLTLKWALFFVPFTLVRGAANFVCIRVIYKY